MAKVYDQAYFDRWYRDPKHRQWAEPAIARKVRMVVGVAEYLLERPIRSVLDVGCGEGSWQPILKDLRPKARYLGIDGSEYAVARFGRERNLRRGAVGDLKSLGIRQQFDVVVCCDVLHYVPTPELKRGVAAMAKLARGPAYLEAYTTADDVTGDNVSFQRRSPATYRRLFAAAGVEHVAGPHVYVTKDFARRLVALERR